MTYFPTSHAPSTVKVAQFREALTFAFYCCRKVASPGCKSIEVIQERSTALLAMFRAMRELQSSVCKRMSAHDKQRYADVLAQATELMEQFGAQYFEYPERISCLASDVTIERNWLGSEMADNLTYIKQPQLYPAQSARVLRELGV